LRSSAYPFSSIFIRWSDALSIVIAAYWMLFAVADAAAVRDHS